MDYGTLFVVGIAAALAFAVGGPAGLIGLGIVLLLSNKKT